MPSSLMVSQRFIFLAWAFASNRLSTAAFRIVAARRLSSLSFKEAVSPIAASRYCQKTPLLYPWAEAAPLFANHAANIHSTTIQKDNLQTASQRSSPNTSHPWSVKHRLDYTPPEFAIPSVELTFQLGADVTQVTAKLSCQRQTHAASDLVLNGEDLTLLEAKLNGEVLHSNEDYIIEEDGSLRIFGDILPSEMGTPFTLETKIQNHPINNLQLSGLYHSNGMLCTQCEAEGFRRITYFIDRPDVMSKFFVRLEGAKSDYPILLSNGNKIASGDSLDGLSHYAAYEDPYSKPSYLFALVAGKLEYIESYFKTKSGKLVQLRIYSEPENIKRLQWAMDSLKQSMEWDEEVFGLEYDLSEFNVVAVNDFNMGAMENKGLNIFNTASLLASANTTSDAVFERVRTVIAHEYFHNWSGNRVTCRDWFQLTLKEGLTVFRDQLFSQTVGSSAVERINQVMQLRSRQFSEDSGPMAHPIRPETYLTIENFYTATVYEKGAEVVRMYYTLLGHDGFVKGMKLYFDRHDGQAVTCDEFRAAMADANNVDFSQFERWYSQAGTPILEVKSPQYNEDTQTYSISFQQVLPTTDKDAPEPFPLHIPIAFCLIGKDSKQELIQPQVLELKGFEQTFTFENIRERPVPSILRGFSAPVKLEYSPSREDLIMLMTHDTDAFVKWDAAQKILMGQILEASKSIETGEPLKAVDTVIIEAFRQLLLQKDADRSLKAYTLQLPSLSTLEAQLESLDPVSLHDARKYIRTAMANSLQMEILRLYQTLTDECNAETSFSLSKESVDRRRLRNQLLVYISLFSDNSGKKICESHFSSAETMTDKLGGLISLSGIEGNVFDEALQQFYDAAEGDALVLNKWFAVQAAADRSDTMSRVQKLLSHPEFTEKNPNRLRSLVSEFANNMKYFHSLDGQGYKLLENTITKVDSFNPKMAAALTRYFSQWKKFDSQRQLLIRDALKNIIEQPNISKDTLEIAAKCLA